MTRDILGRYYLNTLAFAHWSDCLGLVQPVQPVQEWMTIKKYLWSEQKCKRSNQLELLQTCLDEDPSCFASMRRMVRVKKKIPKGSLLESYRKKLHVGVTKSSELPLDPPPCQRIIWKACQKKSFPVHKRKHLEFAKRYWDFNWNCSMVKRKLAFWQQTLWVGLV